MDFDIPEQKSRMTPLWGMFLYLTVGTVWVVVGDALLDHWAAGSPHLARWQLAKG